MVGNMKELSGIKVRIAQLFTPRPESVLVGLKINTVFHIPENKRPKQVFFECSPDRDGQNLPVGKARSYA